MPLENFRVSSGVTAGHTANSEKLQQLLKNEKLNPLYQIKHAEKIGLGSTNYKLVEID